MAAFPPLRSNFLSKRLGAYDWVSGLVFTNYLLQIIFRTYNFAGLKCWYYWCSTDLRELELRKKRNPTPAQPLILEHGVRTNANTNRTTDKRRMEWQNKKSERWLVLAVADALENKSLRLWSRYLSLEGRSSTFNVQRSALSSEARRFEPNIFHFKLRPAGFEIELF